MCRSFLGELSPCIMSVQYTGGVQYNGRCSVHRGNIMSTLGDIMIDVGEGHWENN